MTFYCINCFAEIPADRGACPRCGAVQTLDRRDYAAKLRAALAHPLAETRRRAIFLLGEKRVSAAVGELIEVLDRENDPFLAQEAVIALGKIPGQQSLEALARAARHKSFLVRSRAVEALVSAGGVWRKLGLKIAEHDPSAMVRENARGKVE
jgi:HEAT repeat protein